MSMDAFKTAIADIPMTDDPRVIRRKSRDMTLAFSPIIREEVKDKFAELIVTPRTKDDVIRVAAAAATHRVPVLARGAGTGNWG